MKKSLSLILLTLSTGLVLVGCGGAEEQDVGEHGPGERPEQEQVDTTDETPDPAEPFEEDGAEDTE